MLILSNVQPCFYFHRRRKLFDIGGCQTQRSQLQYLGGGGEVLPKVHIRMRAPICTHMYAHTCVKYSCIHACMQTHVCMHAQPMQTYMLHPDMKIIKFKASELYEKNSNKYIQVNEESLISNDIVSTKIYDKRDDFDFEIVNFPFLDGDVPRSTSYGVYISQLIRFARASSYVTDFNTRNKLLTQKLLKQGYRYHKLPKTFSKFYRRYYDLISKFQVGLKSLLRQGLSEPDFYGDLVYKLKKIVGSNNFSAQFIKIISHYKKIGYNINVLQQTACLVVNPITVGNFAFLFYCTLVGRTSDSMMVPT